MKVVDKVMVISVEEFKKMVEEGKIRVTDSITLKR